MRGLSKGAVGLSWLPQEGVTLRWRRGDAVAQVLDGNAVSGRTATLRAIDTVAVSPDGWTDLTDVQRVARRWAAEHRRAAG